MVQYQPVSGKDEKGTKAPIGVDPMAPIPPQPPPLQPQLLRMSWSKCLVVVAAVAAAAAATSALVYWYLLPPPPPMVHPATAPITPGEVERAHQYARFVSSLPSQIPCGPDCLFYDSPYPRGDRLTLPPAPPPLSPPKLFPTAPPPLPELVVGLEEGEGGEGEEGDDPQCRDIPLERRFDCLPSRPASKQECEARGCCWGPAMPTERKKPYPAPKLHSPPADTPEIRLALPYCYYPRGYSIYQYHNITTTGAGAKPETLEAGVEVGTGTGVEAYLALERASGYPNDVKMLKMEVKYETPTRIRVKIGDPSKVRWEPPIPVVPKVEEGETEGPLAYTFTPHRSDGTFTIARAATNTTLFSTRGAAPVVFSELLVQVSTLLPSDFVYGLGEHLDGLLLDTYWHRRVLWNLDGSPRPGNNLYGSHPFYLAMEGDGNAHGVFLLNSNAIEAVLQPTPALTLRALGGVLDLYVFLGPSPIQVVSQYTQVIGRPFLPPYWSLGYHQCRYGYNSLNKTREVWQRTRNARIPFDVQWNDIDYMDKFKDFTYDKNTYYGLPEFVQEVHEAGMHYVQIVDPAISTAEKPGTYPPLDEGLHFGVFVRNRSDLPFVGKVWNPVSSVWPDFTHPLAIYYWSKQFVRYHDQVPIDGAWIDMNEPSNFWNGAADGCPFTPLEHPPYLPPMVGNSLYYKTVCMTARHHVGLHYDIHNLYGFTEAIATNTAMQVVRGKRPFVISRSSFPGLGKYAGHWTGDIQATWFNLWQSIAGILNFNMFGVPMVGADICGFELNTTAPLCLRWMQLGAFYPFARNHNSDDAMDQDPVAMGEDVVRASREALRMRYFLLPLLYSLFFTAHTRGEPVARPLFFNFPDDPATYSIDTQFMWGNVLMIVPVLYENQTEVKAYLPRGLWYTFDLITTMIEGGGTYHTLEAPYYSIPVLFRGGSAFISQEAGNTTTESRQSPCSLVVAPDYSGRSTGEMYWDDGDSLDTVEKKHYTHIQISGMDGRVDITQTLVGYTAPLTLKSIYLMNVPQNVTEVKVAGKEAKMYFYNSSTKTLFVDYLNQTLLEPFTITWTYP